MKRNILTMRFFTFLILGAFLKDFHESFNSFRIIQYPTLLSEIPSFSRYEQTKRSSLISDSI